MSKWGFSVQEGVDAKILGALLTANVKALKLQSLPDWETELGSAARCLSSALCLATQQIWDKPWLHARSEGHGRAGAKAAELLLPLSSHLLPQVPNSAWAPGSLCCSSGFSRGQNSGQRRKLQAGFHTGIRTDAALFCP